VAQPRVVVAGQMAPELFGAPVRGGAAVASAGGGTGRLGAARDRIGGGAGVDGAGRQLSAAGEQAQRGLMLAEVGQVVGAQVRGGVALQLPGVLW
jgi:hypothetical protein